MAVPQLPLAVASTYTLKLLVPARVKSRNGASYATTPALPPGVGGNSDAGAASTTRWSFTTEPLYGLSPDFSGPIVIPPDDVFFITTNAAVAMPGAPSVKDHTGAPVLVDAFWDTDATGCPSNPMQIDVIHVAAHGGPPIPWPAGTYTIAFAGFKDDATGKSPLGMSAFDPTPLGGSFTVAVGARSSYAIGDLVPPTPCMSGGPPSNDGGAPADGGSP